MKHSHENHRHNIWISPYYYTALEDSFNTKLTLKYIYHKIRYINRKAEIPYKVKDH